MKNVEPPKLAEKLLLLFLRRDLAEEVLGDLDEQFYATISKHSTRKARLNYWYQVIHYLRPFAIKYFQSNSRFNTMIKHNFLIGFRLILKNKMQSSINVGGLALGMVTAILISLWVYDEITYNQYHATHDRVVQVLRKDVNGDQVQVNSSQVSKLGVYLAQNYADLFEEVSTTFYRNGKQFLQVGDRSLERLGYFFSVNSANVLALDFVAGDKMDSTNLYSILLSEQLAETLFPNENPIGQAVLFNGQADLMVRGVYADLPKNSTFHEMEFIVPMELVYNEDNPATWDNQNTKIYGLLHPGVKVEEAERAISNALSANMPNNTRKTSLLLHPMDKWHLNSNFRDGTLVTSERLQYVRIYSTIGAFVLLLAFINFVNLNTARYHNRVREIGVRKAMGSYKTQLIGQFLAESLLYSTSAYVIALLVGGLTIGAFNELSGKGIVIPWGEPAFWLVGICFVLLSAVLSGAYPAFYLSSFDPVKALKGTIRQGAASGRFRQALVTFQFTISIALIMGMITIYKQLEHAKARPVGYNQSDLITARGRSDTYREKFNVLRNELLRTGAVVEVATANYPLTNDLGNNSGFKLRSNNEEFNTTFNTIFVTPEYGQATGFELVKGRDFRRESEGELQNVIISESAVSAMGLENPIGQVIVSPMEVYNRTANYTIIGVVKDMVKHSPYDVAKPLMLFPTYYPTEHIFMRLSPAMDYQQSLTRIEEVYAQILPEMPFNYEFVDDAYSLKFTAEERIGSVASLFTLVAVLISCLGLFGLSAFFVEQRNKEIGVRKVLGASIISLWNLLSLRFSLLILLACVVAMPLAAFVLTEWLNGYTYRISLDWSIYLMAGLGSLVVTLLTVSYHSLRATRANPVDSLRAE
ncbi:MAG: ABC transporter permease [Cyclobacteriaceae bacterium]